MKAIALYRVSTYRQSVEGHSLDAQEERVRKAATFWGADIIKSWRIDASSRAGKNIGRKDLTEALRFCGRNKQVKYFIIDEVDRFMRGIDEYFWYKQEFKMRGVKLVFASQPELNEEGQFAKLREMLAIFEAEASNEERSRKTTDKMKARVAAGYYPFYPRQGYQKSDTPGLHIPDPGRFGTLQQALRAVAALEKTPKQAQQWLYSEGYRTPKGRKLDMNHWSAILRDPYYAGMLRVSNWPESTGLHSPMISRNEFQMNVEIITGRKVKRKRQFNPDFPLNLSYHEPCAANNGKLTGMDHTNGKGWWRKEYVCRTCKKRISRDLVHESFSCLLDSVTPTQRHLKALRSALSDTWKKEEGYRIEEARQLKQQLDVLGERKSRLIESMVSGDEFFDTIKDDLKKEFTTVNSEITRIEQALAGADQVDTEFIEFVDYAINYTQNLVEKWWTLPPEKQRECKQLLFQDEIIVTPDGKVYTPKISPIYTLFNTKSDPKVASNAKMVELAGTAPASVSLTD